jgi:hypothetical protein
VRVAGKCTEVNSVDLSVCLTVRALQMANNLSKGEQLVGGKTLNDNVPLFRDMFEVSELQ